MSLDQVISLLVAVTLIEMSFATGLGVRLADVVGAAKDGQQLLGAGLANYVAVPAAAVTLILLVDADPLVAAGILILAVCPGAPYGPPLTALARGTTATSVGLMVILAGSSVVLAPLLLSVLLPLTTGGADLHVDPLGMFAAIMVIQLSPLCCGLAISHWRPALAERGAARDRDQQDPQRGNPGPHSHSQFPRLWMSPARRDHRHADPARSQPWSRMDCRRAGERGPQSGGAHHRDP